MDILIPCSFRIANTYFTPTATSDLNIFTSRNDYGSGELIYFFNFLKSKLFKCGSELFLINLHFLRFNGEVIKIFEGKFKSLNFVGISIFLSFISNKLSV